MCENTEHQNLYYCPMQSHIKIDEVSLTRRQPSDLSCRPPNSTRSHGRLRSTLIPIKSLSKDPRHQGKTTGCILQLAHSLGTISGQESRLCVFWSQSAIKDTKLLLLPTILSTGIKTPKGLWWTCWLLSQKLVWTSWNREDTEGLCTFSGSWWSQKYTSWACCTGVTQSN